MRPDRLIVGEVREAESLDMLIALNAGLPGMASLHANSARDAVTKICTLPLLAGEALDADLRAEIDLLRAELDLLKREFRRLATE